MMKQFMRALLCLGLLLPFGAKAEIFVFGDSLSDTGNAAAVIDVQFGVPIPSVPPIFVPFIGLCNPVDIVLGQGCDDLFSLQRSVSNGPVAVEVLAKPALLEPSFFFLPLPPPFLPGVRPMAFGTNYAVAGARAGGSSLGDFNAQIAGFLADLANPDLPPDSPTASDALYVVVIGGNDIIKAVKALIAALTGSALDETPRATIAAAVDAIGDNINLLIGAGARKFLVVNSPNIGSIPAIKIAAEEAGVPPALRALLRGLATFVTIGFNKQLAARLDQIRAEQQQIGNPVEIKEFNLFRFFEGVRFDFRLFGLNTVDACFDSGEYRDTGARNFDPDCGVDKFDDFVFFDDLHPTGQVHRFVGKALSRLLFRKKRISANGPGAWREIP